MTWFNIVCLCWAASSVTRSVIVLRRMREETRRKRIERALLGEDVGFDL
jgi:hypothetical protein